MVARVVVGLVATVGGAQLLVEGAKSVAGEVGLTQAAVGFLLVGLGTSLPELATAIQASRRGHAELVAGNVLGSNLFNSLAVAGLAALVRPGQLPDRIATVPVFLMVGVMVALWLVLAVGKQVRRWEGILLVATYVASAAYSVS